MVDNITALDETASSAGSGHALPLKSILKNSTVSEPPDPYPAGTKVQVFWADNKQWFNGTISWAPLRRVNIYMGAKFRDMAKKPFHGTLKKRRLGSGLTRLAKTARMQLGSNYSVNPLMTLQ